MGRNTNTPDPASLDRYSVGEITQLVGQSVFYNAGTSKWLKTGSYTASTNLSTATKSNLAAGSTSGALNVAIASDIEDVLSASRPYSPLPAQRISASGLTVYPLYTAGTGISVISSTSSGGQIVATGLTSYRAGSATGNNVSIASNNTTIFAYTCITNTTFGAVSTTNGTTWSSVTLTGLPAFSTVGTVTAFNTSNTQPNGPEYGLGICGRGVYSADTFAVFWCGARFILITGDSGSTYYVTSTSTNGIAWSGDTTVAVAGSATIQAGTNGIAFYKNGSSCWMAIGSGGWRYTTDGGITWANSTGNSLTATGDYYQKTNSTTPAKLFYHIGTTASRFTADSGATWTSRTLPLTSLTSPLAYKGSTVLQSTSSLVYRSDDDGATWTAVLLPAGTLAQGGLVYADANRFYFVPNGQLQILTSSDAITWTIITLTAGTSTVNGQKGGIIAFSSNTVMLAQYNSASGYDVCLITLDGGVTWTASTSAQGNMTYPINGDVYISPDGLGGGSAAYGGSYGWNGGRYISQQSVEAGGSFYRSGATAITPTNTGALVYVRVE